MRHLIAGLMFMLGTISAFAADTVTTNYTFTKPEVGSSASTWGNKLNANMDSIDAQIKLRQNEAAAAIATANGAMPKSGGTFTGAVNFGGFTLNNAGAPSAGTDVTTKTYVDGLASTLTSNLTAVQTTANAALPKSGGTMTGVINHGGFVASNLGTPSATTDATTKAYVDAAVAAALGAVPSGIPTGAVMAFNLSSCPSGWLAADGTAYALDLRGEFIRGWSNGRSGVDTGRALASAQSQMIEAHTHNAPTLFTTFLTAYGQGSSYSSNTSLGPTSSYGGAETRPRNVALLYCVKS